MNRNCGRRSFYLSVLCAFAALLFTGTFARAQSLYQFEWGGRFNNSLDKDPEDSWVANSFTAGANSNIVSISFPIGENNYTNQAIKAFIYQGSDLLDPTAGDRKSTRLNSSHT